MDRSADAREALTIVEKAGQANGGVLADALHWDRTGGKVEDLILIPPERIHYFQICDAPKDFIGTNSELIRVARGGRLFPGRAGSTYVHFWKRCQQMCR